MKVFTTAAIFYRDLAHHPLASRNRVAAFLRILRWQVASRLMRAPIIVPFVDETCLVLEVGMSGATSNWYFGMMEFEDMCFAAHFLRAGELFADVGSNVGTYSILAAGRGADVIALEPIARVGSSALRNAAINGFSDRIKVIPAAAGSLQGKIKMSDEPRDAVNHVVAADQSGVTVAMVTLDSIFHDRPPSLMKIDVEGFEFEALCGAQKLLADSRLEAIIIEILDFGERYGHETSDIDRLLRNAGYIPHHYDPFTRTLGPNVKTTAPRNFIYLRDQAAVQAKVRRANPIKVLDYSI